MRKKTKVTIIISSIIVFLIAFFGYAFYTRNRYIEIYDKGVSLLEEGKYEEAIDCFNDIPDYIRYQDIAELLDEYDVPVCRHCGSLLE